MDVDRWNALLHQDGVLLADTAERGDLAAAVPPCPGWTVRDVVMHTAEVYQHKIACMRRGARPDPWPPDFSARDPVPFLRESLAELLGELTSRDPDSPTYTWWPADQTVRFWSRRMAQETAVHRVDVQSAFGQVTPVDDELAVDGIDEVLERFLCDDWSDVPPGFWRDISPEAGAGKAVTIRTADRSWRVTLHPDRIDLARDDRGDSDAMVTGEPSELLLWLWGRRPLSAVRADGDAPALTALRDRLMLATQ